MSSYKAPICHHSSANVQFRDTKKQIHQEKRPMGSCVSCSSASASAAESARAATAMVVDMDGCVLRFAAQVTAHEALGAAFRETSHFLCCSDEMEFDAPATALDADDELKAGQLYFALPLSVLRRPLSGQDMAALAVRASAALGAAPLFSDVDAGKNRVAAGVPSLGKSGAGATAKKQQRRQTGRRVAPLDGVSGDGSGHERGEWKSRHVNGGYDAPKEMHGDRTVGKTRQGIRGTRHLAPVQRLSVIVEAGSD
ncbi:hypothetical protein ACP70R_007085 [Stipagrostis hirtigluma subsp. patula]